MPVEPSRPTIANAVVTRILLIAPPSVSRPRPSRGHGQRYPPDLVDRCRGPEEFLTRLLGYGGRMTDLLVGTSAGLFVSNGDGLEPDPSFGGRSVTALAADDRGVWAVADRLVLARREHGGSWRDVAESADLDLDCVLPTPTDVFAGTDEAHLLRLEGDRLTRVDGFEEVEGRNDWYTPWGGPPAVRSMAVDLAGRIHANVHVGGIPRSVDGERWESTIDIDADVHQVVAHPTEPDVVLAAGALGLCISEDGGATWRTERDGLHSSYARAVAVSGETVLLSACTGPHGGRAALYRTTLSLGARFDKCTDGLPEWFDGNVDSGWVTGRGPSVAFGTPGGEIYRSDDAGVRWRLAAVGVPAIRALCLV